MSAAVMHRTVEQLIIAEREGLLAPWEAARLKRYQKRQKNPAVQARAMQHWTRLRAIEEAAAAKAARRKEAS